MLSAAELAALAKLVATALALLSSAAVLDPRIAPV